MLNVLMSHLSPPQDSTLPISEAIGPEVVEGLRREVARLREAEAAAVAHAEDPQGQVFYPHPTGP